MGRDRRTNVLILECFICQWEGDDVGRWGWLECREVTRWEGSEVARWEEGSKVVKLERWESGEVRR